MEFLIIPFKIFTWIFLLILVSFLMNKIWENIIPGKIRQIIIFPGVIIHELSHALGCIITGAKIKEISLFSSRGSYVSHSKPIVPLIGSFIISFSPIAGSILFLFLFSEIFGFTLPSIIFSFDLFYQNFVDTLKESIIFIINNYQFWQFWVFSYLAISLVISLSPSKKDFKNSFLSVLFLAFILIIFSYFSLFSDLIISFFENYLIGVLGIGFFFGLLSVIITLPFYLIKKLF